MRNVVRTCNCHCLRLVVRVRTEFTSRLVGCRHMHMRKPGAGMVGLIMAMFALSAESEMQQTGGKKPDLKNQAQNRYRFPPSTFYEHRFRLAVIRNVDQSRVSILNIGPFRALYIHNPDRSNPSPHLRPPSTLRSVLISGLLPPRTTLCRSHPESLTATLRQ